MLEIYWSCIAEMDSILFVLVFGMITSSSQGLHSFKPGHIRTSKPLFSGCFGGYTDCLSTHTEPDKVTRVTIAALYQ